MVDIPGAPVTLSCTGEGDADENCWNQIAIPWQLGQPGRGSGAPGGVPASSKMAAWISNK